MCNSTPSWTFGSCVLVYDLRESLSWLVVEQTGNKYGFRTPNQALAFVAGRGAVDATNIEDLADGVMESAAEALRSRK